MTTTPAEYKRRFIPPTATAEQLAQRFVDALDAIRSTYAPLVEESTAAVLADHGFDIAEQLIADLEHQYDAAHEWLRSQDIQNIEAYDGLSELVIGLVGTWALDDALNEHSAARQAHNAAHERWLCAKYEIPADVSESGAA